MAIILPSLHSKNLRLTPGERRFGTALLRNLEDDYFCWVGVPVGPKQRRPDFVVLHPGRGMPGIAGLFKPEGTGVEMFLKLSVIFKSTPPPLPLPHITTNPIPWPP